MKLEAKPTDAPAVLIVGGGMAGLCAAVSALEAGAAVTVIEKSKRLGGSMRLSNGLVWTFKEASALRSEVRGNESLQDMVFESHLQDLGWLESQGVECGPVRPFQWYGQGRTVAPDQVISAMVRRVELLGGRIRTDVAMHRLRPVRNWGYEVDVYLSETDTSTLEADAVILATGGFQGNPELVARWITSETDNIYLRANPWSTGDGLTAAMELGAALTRGMGEFYGHAMAAPPARFGPRQFSDMTQRYGNYALALNLSGRRFVDESAGTGEEALNAEIARQEKATAIYIIDNDIAAMSREFVLAPPHVSVTRAEAAGASVLRKDSIEALADSLKAWGLPAQEVLNTIQAFNTALAAGTADQLVPPRRRNLHPIATAPFTAVKVRAGITFTCGGLATDVDMRVLRRTGTVSTLPMLLADTADVDYCAFPNLYAAGCDVGGLSNRGYMGGLACALVTGRKAGAQAAASARVR
ncbi:FAD-dependent oxidoreductase [Candidimonas nitroreducens]|uniref:FAD-dependent oxidoreductase n=1 Tax=Candidimonas nitroreducens TaxID=683354 RepID=UPI0013036267|nr:FAD-dependent oxidoreductase [Candidimonas nitroreducens]